MNHKQKLGQFYTTNYEYILQNMSIPENIKTIIEPFVGNGDLLNFIKNKERYDIEMYDIDPKISDTICQDTIKMPPNFNNKFILTNPPYLARNKNADKELYDLYNANDLYKCFIKILCGSNCMGGIIIIPLNFICSIRKNDIELRKEFFGKFNVNIINIFEEKVFNDTAYTICSIFFTRKENNNFLHTKIFIYPSKKEMNVIFNEDNNFTIGGEIYNLPQNIKLKVERATKLTKNNFYISNILLKCIDDSINNKLGFKISTEKYIDTTEKLSARSYATLVFNKHLSIEEENALIEKLNKYLEFQRNKYNSLFLTNYRESNSIARKRISFDLAFKICNYMLNQEE